MSLVVTAISSIVLGWTALIVGWWLFWGWYGHGALRPASWRAVLMMPLWSVRSIQASLWHKPDDTLTQLRTTLRNIRAIPESDQVRRYRVADLLEESSRDALSSVPTEVRMDYENTIRILRGEDCR